MVVVGRNDEVAIYQVLLGYFLCQTFIHHSKVTVSGENNMYILVRALIQ
jgi:hypothetical protein